MCWDGLGKLGGNSHQGLATIRGGLVTRRLIRTRKERQAGLGLAWLGSERHGAAGGERNGQEWRGGEGSEPEARGRRGMEGNDMTRTGASRQGTAGK